MYLERGDAVSVLFVVEPLAFVLEAVGSLADAKSGPLVILPLAHVRLGDAGIQRLVLCARETGKKGRLAVRAPDAGPTLARRANCLENKGADSFLRLVLGPPRRIQSSDARLEKRLAAFVRCA